MTSRERFMKAIKCEKPDRVPIFDYLFQKDIFEAVIKRRPETYNNKDVIECCLKLGIDAAALITDSPQDFKPRFLSNDMYIDEWGTARKIDNASWPTDAPVDFPIKDRIDFRNYKFPDPALPERYLSMKESLKLNSGNLCLIGGVLGPFSTAWNLMGPTNLLMGLYDDDELIKEIFKMSNNYFIESAKLQVAAGVDCIFIAEDLGHSAGPLISLKMFQEILLPYLYELVKSIDVPVLLHCCGDFRIFIHDLVKLGFSAIHPFQRNANMDIWWFKNNYGSKTAIIGNVNSSSTLPYGNEDDIEWEVRECIKSAGDGGGYVLASDHSLHDGIPVKNIFKMIESCIKYGSY